MCTRFKKSLSHCLNTENENCLLSTKNVCSGSADAHVLKCHLQSNKREQLKCQVTCSFIKSLYIKKCMEFQLQWKSPQTVNWKLKIFFGWNPVKKVVRCQRKLKEQLNCPCKQCQTSWSELKCTSWKQLNFQMKKKINWCEVSVGVYMLKAGENITKCKRWKM